MVEVPGINFSLLLLSFCPFFSLLSLRLCGRRFRWTTMPCPFLTAPGSRGSVNPDCVGGTRPLGLPEGALQ